MKIKHFIAILNAKKEDWNKAKLKKFVKTIVKIIGVKPIGKLHCTYFQADPSFGFSEGYTVHQTIGQSSIDLHTFFENNKIIIDILACGEEINISALQKYFKESAIAAKLYKVKWIKCG